MMVLGIDPGTKRANVKTSAGVTWAVVEHDDHSKWVRWVDGGSFDPTRAKIEAFALHMRRVDACGVEAAAGAIFAPYRAPGVLAQNIVAGMILMAMHTHLRKHRLLQLSPEQWRGALTGQKVNRKRKGVAPMTFDELIAQHLRVTVRGMPATSSSHLRDATGLAVVVGRAIKRGLVKEDGSVIGL